MTPDLTAALKAATRIVEAWREVERLVMLRDSDPSDAAWRAYCDAVRLRESLMREHGGTVARSLIAIAAALKKEQPHE